MILTPTRVAFQTRFWLEIVGDKPPWFCQPAFRGDMFLPRAVTLKLCEKKGVKRREEFDRGVPKIGKEKVLDVAGSTREVFVPAKNSAGEPTIIWVLKDLSWFISDCSITRTNGPNRHTFNGQLSYGADGAIGLTGYHYTS